MAGESRRKSVLAIVEEVTEGTPVFPSSGTDYVAIQQGFTMEPENEILENEEISPVIGVAKPIIKKTKTTSEVSHYLRGSGQIATEPNYGKLIKGALGTRVAAHANDRLTTTGGTAGTATEDAVINLASGGGDFERGKAVLYDKTYIRNVMSVSTNALSLGFNLPNAPVTGKTTGRAILYKPADTLPSFSFFEFMANGAAVQLGAGMKFDSMTISIEAGKLINCKFAAKGTSYYFDPIELTASNNKLDIEDDSAEVNVVVPVGVYLDPHELAEAIGNACASAGYPDTITVSYTDTGAAAGKFTFASDGTELNLLWNTGVNTAQTIGAVLGFNVAADDTGSLSYTSDNEKSWVSPYTPTPDSNVSPLAATNTELMMGTRDRYGCAGVRTCEIKVTNEFKDDEFVCGNDERILINRTIEVSLNTRLTRHDAMAFKKFRTGEEVRFQFSAGRKVGSQWVEGSIVNAFSPQMVITNFQPTGDDTVDLNIGLRAYVQADGLREFYMNKI